MIGSNMKDQEGIMEKNTVVREWETIRLEFSDRIAAVTFSVPEKLNALTPQLLQDYSAALEEITQYSADGKKISAVILTGEGKAFIAGADITHMIGMTPAEAAGYAAQTTALYTRMENMPQIFIAAVNGFALGGGFEMALACDLRLASEKAKFGLPEVSLGILPGGGGTQRLPRLIGPMRAGEIIYTAKTINAAEAFAYGIVNKVTPPDELMKEAVEMAGQIAGNSGSAVALAKEAVSSGMQADMTTATELEKNLFAMCFAAPDQREGMTAFVEKRRAVFR